jgi:hypothetical protein
MAGRKPNYSLIEAVKEMAAQGKSRDDVSIELGISYDMVRYYARRYNIEIARKARKKRPISGLESKIKKYHARIKQIKGIINNGECASLRKISRRVGLSYESVRYLINLAGLHDDYINKKMERKQKRIEDIAGLLRQAQRVKDVTAAQGVSETYIHTYIKKSRELEEAYKQMRARAKEPIQKRRETIGKYLEQGFIPPEIAEKTGMPLCTVYSHVRRSAELRQLYENKFTTRD